MMKRIICFMMAVVAAGLLVACGSENQPNTDHSQSGDKDSQSVNKDTETVSPPDAPTEALQYMDYHEAYDNYEDISSQVTTNIIPFPSTQAVDATSITEFYTADDFQSYADTFNDMFYHIYDELTMNENGFSYAHYWSYESEGPGNRFFFLKNPEISTKLCSYIRKVVYDSERKAMYVMLEYQTLTYADLEFSSYDPAEFLNETKAVYNIVTLNYEAGGFDKPIDHICFVMPEDKPLIREDIDISVVSYDEKYQTGHYFEHGEPSVDARSFSFPSTQPADTTKLEYIHNEEEFMSYLNQYSDIMDHSNDGIAMGYEFIQYIHGGTGIEAGGCALQHIFIQSPELNGQYGVTPSKVYYHEDTQTAYIYLETNEKLYPHYEGGLVANTIKTTSQATYIMLTAYVEDRFTQPVSNIVIVLPEQTAE